MPSRSWQILSAVIAFAGPAVAQAAPPTEYEAAYENCATFTAKRFSSGTDAADLIAQSSLDSCQSTRRGYAQALQRAGGDANVILSMLDQFDAALLKKLKLLILEARVRK